MGTRDLGERSLGPDTVRPAPGKLRRLRLRPAHDCVQSLFRKGRAQNFLDPEHGEQIINWFRAFEDVEDHAKVVSLDEIKDEGGTLNISRYVLPPIGEDIPPLPEAVAAFKEALADARAAEDQLRTVLTDGGWVQE